MWRIHYSSISDTLALEPGLSWSLSALGTPQNQIVGRGWKTSRQRRSMEYGRTCSEPEDSGPSHTFLRGLLAISNHNAFCADGTKRKKIIPVFDTPPNPTLRPPEVLFGTSCSNHTTGSTIQNLSETAQEDVRTDGGYGKFVETKDRSFQNAANTQLCAAPTMSWCTTLPSPGTLGSAATKRVHDSEPVHAHGTRWNSTLLVWRVS